MHDTPAQHLDLLLLHIICSSYGRMLIRVRLRLPLFRSTKSLFQEGEASSRLGPRKYTLCLSMAIMSTVHTSSRRKFGMPKIEFGCTEHRILNTVSRRTTTGSSWLGIISA